MKSEEALTSRVLHGFKWQYLSAGVQALSRLVILSGLAHLLSPRDFGILGIAIIFTSLAERVGQIGVGPAIVQRGEVTEAHLRTGFSLSLIFGLIIFGVLYFSSPLVARFFHEEALISVLRVVSLVFVIESFGMISEALLQRHLRFKELLFADNVSYIIGSGIIGMGLAALGYGVWALVGAILMGRFIKVVVLVWYEPRNFSLQFSKKEAIELTNLGFGYSLGRILNYGALQGDNFMVGRILGADALGVYGRAYQLMTLPATYFGVALDRVLYPAMSRKQEDRKGLGRSFLYSIEVVGLIALPASIFMYVFSPEMVWFLFGDQWGAVIPPLQILSLGIFARTSYKSCDTLVRALGAPYLHASRQVVYTIAVISGSIIGSYWGLTGVATAVLGAVTLNYLLMSRLSLQLLELPIKSFLRIHLPAIWVSLFLYLVLELVAEALRSQHLRPIFSLMIGLILSGLVSLAALYFSPAPCRLTIAGWITRNFRLHERGRFGRLAQAYVTRVGNED